MTALVDTTPDTPVTEVLAAEPVASWPVRVGAFAIDVGVGIAVVATMAVVALTAPRGSSLWWAATVLAALVVLAMAVNRWVLPAGKGFSLGRAVFGIAVRTGAGAPVGMWRLLGRDVAHLLDTAALFVGWLWPLWDRRRRTFADLLLRTEVRPVPPPAGDARRWAAIAMVVATMLCAVAVGLSYTVVYRHELAVDNTRQHIAEQGPRIVEEMLSYQDQTLQQDFARAQALTTDRYRPQLIAQQQAVQQSGIVSNEYFAVSSAVLSATPDTAAMLMAMQGQRGADAEALKFITATVRVDFEKAPDGKWLVSNLSVLKKPLMNAQGQ